MIEIPGYNIKGEIGQGGMASVYLAVQSSLDRQVALKVMAPALAADPTFTRRFLQEARTLASLAHPNIVQVFDVGVTSNQQHYFSMQYLAGGDFVARVQRGIMEADLKTILNGVAKALGYAHQRGYVHRDVAPGNILFDASGSPVLTDFGIALAASQATRITSTGLSVGTSHYMSPEQARGGDIDARSDLYSLGVLAYFGLIGKTPFDGADGFAVAYAHVFEPIPRLPDQFAHWQPLFDRAMAKDPKDRFADVDAFMAGLDTIPLPATPNSDGSTVKLKNLSGKSSESSPAPVVTRTPPTVVNARPDVLKRTSTVKVATPAKAVVKPLSGARAPSRTGVWVAVLALGLLGSAALAAYFWPRGAPREVASTVATLPERPVPPPVTTSPVVQNAAVSTPATQNSSASVAPVSAPITAVIDGTTSSSLAPPSLPSTPVFNSDEVAVSPPTPGDGEIPADGSAEAVEIPTVEDPVPKLVKLGRADLAAQRLTTPAGSNALDRFKLALRIDARDKGAKQGINDTARAYLVLGEKAYAASDLNQMSSNFARALEIAALVPEAKPVADDVAQRRAGYAGPLLEDAKRAAGNWDKDAAKLAYDKALAVDPVNAVAQEGLRKLPSVGSKGFVFRDSFKDGSQGPDLVVLAGAKLAAGRNEVSRGEFRRYWNAAGSRQFGGKEPSCRDRESFFRSSRKRNWQNADIAQEDNHPVVCITAEIAAGFAAWLSEQTGRRYRLLSTVEWDQLAREVPAGDCRTANLADAAYNKAFDAKTGAGCDDSYPGTAPVGRFGATGAGLYDIDGNVREWVHTCATGGANCRDHLVRGRSFMSPPDKEAASYSDKLSADLASNTIGLRVARELDARK